MVEFDEKLNKVLSVANVVIPFIQASLLLIANFQQGYDYWNTSSIVTLYFVGLLQLVSVCYLLYAVLNIRKHLASQGPQQVNVKILIVNLGAFGLYLASVVVYYIFYTILYTDKNPTNGVIKQTFISWIISAICSAIAQLCICAICWQVASAQTV